MNRAERLKLDKVEGDPILFYRPQDQWGVFSNFSKHEIWLPHPFDSTGSAVTYRTSEHRYQAMKATTEQDHEYVRAAPTASESKKRGGPNGIELRPNWGDRYGDLCYFVMLELIIAKAKQVPEFMNALQMARIKGTHIYEDSPTDDIWGWRYRNDYRGRNLLGRAIMQTRDWLVPYV